MGTLHVRWVLPGYEIGLKLTLPTGQWHAGCRWRDQLSRRGAVTDVL
ncbi:MAG: hypothetical protein OJF49_002191 [Ktedonobacterales bacterium]|nr:MAG: hypothetical protein OJF49_002191 [Ktedonobacterales bacterium]